MQKVTGRKKFYIAYMLISLIMLVDITVILTWQISLAGYWSDRLVFWIWLLTTLPFLIIFWKSIYTKIYCIVLVLGLLFSIAAMMLPFFGILFSSTGMERRSYYTPDSGKYRVQLIQSVMARPRLQIIKNKGIVEKVILFTDADFLKNDHLKVGYESVIGLDVLKDTPDSLVLEFHMPGKKIVKGFKLNDEKD
ncbi:hypothetical protein [Sphingobacterium anhuiense]|uniref:Uncharacterized protein n=1 Tax=Sphingobacterium anhuiense TaxID=493780 RepID=A0ABW5YTW7_9SPHI